jgi:hypothetical protein
VALQPEQEALSPPPSKRLDRLSVLVARPNLLTNISGVERFYQRLIPRHPDIRFTVLQTPESTDGLPRLPNVEIVPYRAAFGRSLTANPGSWIREALVREAWNIAASVADRSFDVVDGTTNFPIAHLLPAAFAANRVKAGLYSLGLHGWSSESNANEFDGALRGALVAELSEHELLALEAADLRYAFSPMCLDDCRMRTALPVLALDPGDMLPVVKPGPAPDVPGDVMDLVQIGARAGYKGGDLLLHMLSGVPKRLVGRARFVGSDGRWGPDSIISPTEHLRACATQSSVEADFVDSPSDAWIETQVYGRRTAVALCSRPRSETFGFSAAEALLHGTPVLLSRYAGLARVLRDTWTWIPATIVDPFDADSSRRSICDLAANYDRHRDQLRDALARRPLHSSSVNYLAPVFASDPDFSSAARAAGAEYLASIRFTEADHDGLRPTMTGATTSSAFANTSTVDTEELLRKPIAGDWFSARDARIRLSPRGWSEDEDEGVWIVGDPASFFVAVDTRPARIRLRVSGFSPDTCSQKIAILELGTAREEQPLCDGETEIDLTCTVPPETTLRGGRFLEIKLRLPAYAVPVERGRSGDPRRLRFFVRKLRIDVVEAGLMAIQEAPRQFSDGI